MVMKVNTIDLEQGRLLMQKSIDKFNSTLEGMPEPQMGREEYMMLVKTMNYMCALNGTSNYVQQMYVKYQESVEEYIKSNVLPSLREKQTGVLLNELYRRWSTHKLMVQWLSESFFCLDCFVTTESLPSLKEIGLKCFRNLVYREKFRDVAISLIRQEREGEQIDQALLKKVMCIFVGNGVGRMDYYIDFEAAMLEETTDYYSRKACVWILEDSCPDYMLKIETCLDQEKCRVKHYLRPTSGAKLVKKVEHELLFVYATRLLENEHSGCKVLLRDDKVEHLSRMYKLFSTNTRGLNLIFDIFKQHATDEGAALVKYAEDVASNKKVFVEKVMELHDTLMRHVSVCFQNNKLFHKALVEVFESSGSRDIAGSSCAQILAIFCDNLLKEGWKGKLGDDVVEEKLTKVVKMLDYISDKDLFAEFYRRRLALRLIVDRGVNVEHERSVLRKLKQQYGSLFTSKMERMVTDMTFARENQTSFEEFLKNNSNANLGIDLKVSVLNTCLWPSHKSLELKLPAEMAECLTKFTEFYKAKTQQRKLTWVHSLGICYARGEFESKPKELVLNTYQAAALMLFNTSDRLSFQDIRDELNLPEDYVVRVLHSLSCAKHRILIKEPSTKTISPSDFFEFNSKFSDIEEKIKIPFPHVDEKEKDVVVEDRRYAIDACIVRIMKTRKELEHKQLVEECYEQLRGKFKPDKRSIKERIQNLMAREFLERDRDNPEKYKFIG